MKIRVTQNVTAHQNTSEMSNNGTAEHLQNTPFVHGSWWGQCTSALQ